VSRKRKSYDVRDLFLEYGTGGERDRLRSLTFYIKFSIIDKNFFNGNFNWPL